MVISYCVPCHERLDDLLEVLPPVWAAAQAGAPVEIVVVDYACRTPIEPFVRARVADLGTSPVVALVVRRYTGRTWYHMAHARNLSVRAATGDYVVISSTDIRPVAGYFTGLRERIATTGAIWLKPAHLKGVICCQRRELHAAGGFDERFEFYGPEDTDLEARLRRRGAPWAAYPHQWLSQIPTPDHRKVTHYRLPLTKREMSQRGKAILDENVAAGALVDNAGQSWGRWDA